MTSESADDAVGDIDMLSKEREAALKPPTVVAPGAPGAPGAKPIPGAKPGTPPADNGYMVRVQPLE